MFFGSGLQPWLGDILPGMWKASKIIAVCAAVLIVMMHFRDRNPPGAQAAAVAAPPVREQANPARAQGCLVALSNVGKAWRNYKRDGKYGTVEVGDGYYLAAYENKVAMDQAFRCVLTEGRTGDDGLTLVEYKDFRSHKDVALWSDSMGFSVN